MASRTAYSTWTPQKPKLFDGHYLRNRSTLDINVLGYIGIVQHKEHSPEVLSIPPGTLCIYIYIYIYIYMECTCGQTHLNLDTASSSCVHFVLTNMWITLQYDASILVLMY